MKESMGNLGEAVCETGKGSSCPENALSATVLQIERWRTGGQRENTQKLIRLRPALTYPGVVLPVMQGIRFPVTCSESCVTEALYLFGRIPLGTITTSDGIQAAIVEPVPQLALGHQAPAGS